MNNFYLKWSHYPSISVQLFVLSFKIHFFCSNRLQWSIILFLQSNCFDSLFGWKDTGMPHASASTTLPGAVERTFENLLEFCTTLNLPIERKRLLASSILGRTVRNYFAQSSRNLYLMRTNKRCYDGMMVVVKQSACLPSTLIIRVLIPLKSTIFL